MDDVKEKPNEIPGILIMSHGPMCQSIIESGKMIDASVNENVYALPFFEDTDIDEYVNKAISIYTSMPVGSVILFDLFAGTPFNKMVSESAARGIKIHGLCGVSLPILLEACGMRTVESGDELINELVEVGQTSIVNVGKYIKAIMGKCN